MLPNRLSFRSFGTTDALTLAQKASAWDKSEIEMTPAERAYTLNAEEQRVKALQDERIEEWRLRKIVPTPTPAPPKQAAATRAQQLQRAQELEAEHHQPDRSELIHDFGNGWTIREPQTLGDLRREGELMGNCFRPQLHEGVPETMNPEYMKHIDPPGREDEIEPKRPFFVEGYNRGDHPEYQIARLDLMPWYEPLREKGRFYSLRDPDNLPHVSIDHGDEYNGVLGKHNTQAKPEHQAMVDDWETKEYGEPLGGFRESSVKKDELHIGASIPKQAGVEINQWVHDQKWPEGTELEDIDQYHITMLFLQGEGTSKHREDDWSHSRHAVTVKGIREFPPSEERDGLHPIVLLVEGESLQGHHEELVDKAEGEGLETGEYVRDKYTPHITIAYGPSLPDGISPPSITFETEESSVSDAREDKERTLDDVFADSDGSYGDMWVNKEKKKVNFTFGDWEPELHDEAKELIEKEYPNYDLEGESGDPSKPAQYNKETGEIDHDHVPGWEVVYQHGEKVSKIASREWVCPNCNHGEFDSSSNEDAMMCPDCGNEMYPYPREDFYETLNPKDLPEGGLWHMAPTEERARIRQHGLMPSRPKNNPLWGNTFGIAEQQEGVYGTPYQEDTEDWGDPAKRDMWFIPHHQIRKMNRDPLVRAFSVPHPVQPELHTPAEAHWDWQNPYPPGHPLDREASASYTELVKFASEYPTVNWPKLAAEIMEEGLAPKGMPRPLGEHPELGLRPVPWSQKNLNQHGPGTGWGMVHADRSKKARQKSLCLLCGDPVDQGKVFVDVKARKEFADEYGHTDLLPWARADQSSPIVDRGAMHDRCAELTAAHCPHIKDAINGGGVLIAPYRREAPGSPLSQEMKQRYEQAMQTGGTYSSDSWRPKTLWPPGESEGEGTTADHGDVFSPYTFRDPEGRTDDECRCGTGEHCTVHPPEDGVARTWRTVAHKVSSWVCPECGQGGNDECDCKGCGYNMHTHHTPQSDWHTKGGWSGIPQAFGKREKVRQTEKPQKCTYCKEPATKSLLWAEGMAFIPVCDKHEQKARDKVGEDEVCGVHKIKTAGDITQYPQYIWQQVAQTNVFTVTSPASRSWTLSTSMVEHTVNENDEIENEVTSDLSHQNRFIDGSVKKGSRPDSGFSVATVTGSPGLNPKKAVDELGGDSRAYQDSHMLAPNLPNEKGTAMDADGNYRGCTCEFDKLKCPIHGMNPTQDDPGMEWSIAQGSPVGWHEENYTKHNDT